MYADWRWKMQRSQGRSKPKVLTPSTRREVIEQLVQTRLSVMRACQIADLSRAVYYKRPALASERDAEVIVRSMPIVPRHYR
ncbi:MAG: hypothetical protein EBU46_21460 [Nitrosomonadaceae bacterium]|nr:hypothetical protein [Nitrosomonadaceae bacterium]